MLYLVIGIIVLALIFDYINGFHDAANSIATVVATKVLHPRWAVAWAAFWNFVAVGFEHHVANTIGKGIISPPRSGLSDLVFVIMAGLAGAILWDLLTWIYGLPISSSHALIGGFVGAALTKWRTTDVLVWSGLYKTVAFIVLSPVIGVILGFAAMTVIMWICRHRSPGKIDTWFRRLQLLSAAAYSLGHGMNDAQKTMGIIWILLIAGGLLAPTADLPRWVVVICCAAIALGTLTGGWRIVRTMGLRITKLRPVGGFAAETAGAFTLIGLSMHGVPVSTTHTITGAIVGVGATNRLSAVRWGVAGRIVWAWVLTIPMSALIAGLTYRFLDVFV